MEVQHDVLEDKMIKIVNITGSMRKKALISSKFFMVSKEKHWIFLDIYKHHEVTIPTNQESRQSEVPTSGYARITECNTSWNQFWTARSAEVKQT
jgi:hypothetical protein